MSGPASGAVGPGGPSSRPLDDTRDFFGARAAGWDERFAADGPAFARAVAELGVESGAAVLDAGCGTGRAMPALRAAVGPTGIVVGLDVTGPMLEAAGASGRRLVGALVLGDVDRLPVRDATVDGVFAAGLLTHVPDPAATLREVRRITQGGGCLVVFHPVGRRALAARHGRRLRPDELLDPSVLLGVLTKSRWELEALDDGDDRYLARARAR